MKRVITQMNKPEIILVGGGGHCKSCIEVIEDEGVYDIKGIIDLPNLLGTKTMGYSVIGNDDELPKFIVQGYSFLISMGHLGNANRRNQLFEHISSLGGNLPIIIAPSAFVSKRAKIQNGTIIMHQCIVNADSSIGSNCIVNNKSLIEHESSIGNHCHIATGTIVNGNCTVGLESFLGSGTILKNGISISRKAIIGAGSLVVKNIEMPGTYIGSPVNKIN